MGGTIYFTADLHLGHKLVSEIRGFSSTEEHDAYLADMWDSTVKPGDVVKVLGDLCIGRGRPHTNALHWLDQRPGIIDFVFGNHDQGHPMHSDAHKVQADYFPRCRSAQAMGMQKIAGERVLLNHFPYASDRYDPIRYPEWRMPDCGKILIHGHTHSEEAYEGGNEIHVGLDAHGLKLVPMSWVQRIVEGIQARRNPPERDLSSMLSNAMTQYYRDNPPFIGFGSGVTE